MPSRVRKYKSSRERRIILTSFIDEYGDIILTVYNYCRVNKKVCRVYVRSSRCNECNRSNFSDCDIRVTSNEFSKLARERKSLVSRIDKARAATVAAQSVVMDA